MASTSLTDLSSSLQQQISSYTPGDEQQRQKLLALTQDLLQRIETPEERVARMIYVDNYLFAATRVLLDLDIFRILAHSPEPLECSALAEKTGASTELLERLLKFICTQGFVHETGPDTYVANPVTRVVASDGGAGSISDMFLTLKLLSRFPDFLKETAYANPVDKDKSPWKYGIGTDDHYFAYISRPGRELMLQNFMNHMAWKTLGAKWFEMPDIMQAVFGDEKLSHDEVLIVDVGGSGGHDLVSFKQAHPDLAGRIILEDLPATIEGVDTELLAKHHIEPKPHDFFIAQPIQGAKAYYLKMVLHDWPDQQCVEILSQLKPALKHGYSRILLNEIVIPEEGCNWFEAGVDMIMLTTQVLFVSPMCSICPLTGIHSHSAHERRERQWRDVIAKVGGLKVNKIWNVDGAVERVIEIQLQ